MPSANQQACTDDGSHATETAVTFPSKNSTAATQQTQSAPVQPSQQSGVRVKLRGVHPSTTVPYLWQQLPKPAAAQVCIM